jgi:site-specific recombinase XerD
MIALQHRDDYVQPPNNNTFVAFPAQPRVLDNDVHALITDFFDWLETEWQYPLSAPQLPRETLPSPFALLEEHYTMLDLSLLYGYHIETIRKMLRYSGLLPDRRTSRKRSFFFTKQDLAPLIQQWEWDRLNQALIPWWLRFFPPGCGSCERCRSERAPIARQLFCTGHATLIFLRAVVTHFFQEVYRIGSVNAWWQEHQSDVWNKNGKSSAWGIIFIYLLDRRLLYLTFDQLAQLEPLCHKGHHQLSRLWRNRRPEEYTQFLQAMERVNVRNAEVQGLALTVFSLLVLLKYGLVSLTELGRFLSAEELQQVCDERRFVAMHIGGGVFLPYPRSANLQVGHVVLDDIRSFFWKHGARQKHVHGTQRWDLGPRSWTLSMVGILEQALAAPVYESTTGILQRRPETERKLINPLRLMFEQERTNAGYGLLPTPVQESIMTYVRHAHQELRMELTSLRSRLGSIVHFFTWVRVQGKLANYPHWTREATQEIFRSYLSVGCAEVQATTKEGRLQDLVQFLTALAQIEYPIPAGHLFLYTMQKREPWRPRAVPREEIMDRLFKDGVCNLTYDPFARLALTIQYYCGSRGTETCDLHLFSILENHEGHAYLLIPKGKTKQERPFPIVELGMGPLLEYMDEIVTLRLSPDGTSRLLGKTNFRYLETDPERARDWQYLFERIPDAQNPKRHGRLSRGRVAQALREALRIAAHINPDGFFQPNTYHTSCRYRRRKGLFCHFFAARDGITTCPCCRTPLSGKRGTRCNNKLKEDFQCDGIAERGEAFCPKCDAPLADLLPITPHVFRHNSVSRAHRAGVSLMQNMRLHGHQTVPMHLRYLHLMLEDTTNEVRHIFAEKRLRDVRQVLGTTAGKIVEGGIAYTVSLEHYLGITLQRSLKRRTYGIWGGFWAGALAQRGVASPLSVEDEIVIPEDTYEHTVAQYWYEALGLAVSEVAFEYITKGKWHAEVPLFLDRNKIEALVQFHLHHLQDSFKSALGQRLMETDILEQRRFLDELAEKLRPWWQHLGAIDQLVEMFAPGGGHAFQKQLPSTEPAS